MIGRLGKQAAEVALQFLADGMPLDDAVRAGSKLMDEELSPAAEMMLKQNRNASTFPYAPTDLSVYDPSQGNMSGFQRSYSRNFSDDSPPLRRALRRSAIAGDFARFLGARPRETRKYAADFYALRQLLLDAAEGDTNVAYALAQRLGFEGLLF